MLISGRPDQLRATVIDYDSILIGSGVGWALVRFRLAPNPVRSPDGSTDVPPHCVKESVASRLPDDNGEKTARFTALAVAAVDARLQEA